MAFDIDTVDFDTLACIWLEEYGDCSIRDTFANDAISPKHLKEKRALSNKIVLFLTQNNVPCTPLCIDRFIDAIEPTIDLTDYDKDIDFIEWPME